MNLTFPSPEGLPPKSLYKKDLGLESATCLDWRSRNLSYTCLTSMYCYCVLVLYVCGEWRRGHGLQGPLKPWFYFVLGGVKWGCRIKHTYLKPALGVLLSLTLLKPQLLTLVNGAIDFTSLRLESNIFNSFFIPFI